jgi:hypothetical protein
VRGDLPAQVETSEPEGFAFYALDPALHALAARRLAREVRPARALCLGLRSIGTTLSAVVAAALEAEGVEVASLTLRPRGHPFEREVRVGPGLARVLAEADHVLVVDEGPGISGSSLAAAAEAASWAGVPDHRILLMPSWEPEAAALRSPRARAAWARHPRRVASFEEAVLPDLAAPWGGGSLRDLGGGLWRDLHAWDGEPPAVHPHHERRKYLLERPGAAPVLLRFAGLGRRGERVRARALRHAEAGVGPGALGLHRGFLAQPWLAGRPAWAPDLDGALIAAMAGHVAALARLEATSAPAPFDDLLAMTRANAAEALGPHALGATAWMDGLRGAALARPMIAGDGRMAPHEWVLTAGGLVKLDGTRPPRRPLLAGPAGRRLGPRRGGGRMGHGPRGTPGARGRLRQAERRRGRARRPAAQRGRLHGLALGYAHLAAETLGMSNDGRRMAALRDRLLVRLPRALAGEPW